MRNASGLPHPDATPESFTVLRLVICGLWLVDVVTTPLIRLAALPRDLFQPPGILWVLPPAVIDLLLAPAALVTLQVAAAAALLHLALRPRSTALVVVTCALVTLHSALTRAWGHLGHGEIALLLSLYIVALFTLYPPADPGTATPDRAGSRANPWAIPWIVVLGVLAWTYLSVGVFRLTNAPGVLLSDAMERWAAHEAYRARSHGTGLGLGLLLIDRPGLTSTLTVGFAVATLAEVSAPLILVSRRFRYAWIGVMTGFHVGTWAVMGIAFRENMALILLALPVSRWVHPARTSDTNRVVFFDGHCGLCDRFVSWLLRRDRSGIFRVAPLQGRTARYLLPSGRRQARDVEEPRTIVLVEGRTIHQESDAVLRILSALGGPLRLAGLALVLPAGLRDPLYRIVARHRFAIFGRRERCRLPVEGERSRFLP